MKRIISILSLCALLLCAVLVGTACAKGADTKAPTALSLDMDSQTLKWKRVLGVRAYEIEVSGEERTKTTQATYFSLEYLEPGDYTIRVRALNPDMNADPSEWVSFEFTREKESGLKYKLINNRTEYQVIGGGTALGDVVMEDLYRGKPVTSIADKAFANNRKITSLVVGSNVKTIGKNAFIKCSELKSITIPASVTSIGEYAFQSCKQLTSVSIPDSVTEITPYMFSWCSSLTSITLGNKTVSIGDYAFSNCDALESISIPVTVKSIGEYAFSDCKKLTAIDLGDSMETLGDFAFMNCTSITSVDFGESLKSIGSAAFGNCAGITAITLPESTEVIGSEAFFGCTALNEITVGNSLKQIGSYAFYDTAALNAAEGVFYLNSWIVSVKDKTLTNLIPKEGTYGIADSAFSNCKEMQSLSFTGIKYVGAQAFMGCEKLWQVIFDDSLLMVYDSAFANCSNLTDPRLGNSLISLGDYAFRGCTRLVTMELPDTLTTVGSYCFNNTMAYNSAKDVVYVDDWAVALKQGMYIDHIFIKEGTRGIANYCFNKAMILQKQVIMPESLEYIGRGAFYNCNYASGLILPDSLKYIGDYAFYGCSSAWFTNGGITKIPAGTEYIGRSAFYNCTLMIGVDIPTSVKYIGMYAFYGCANMGDSQIWASIQDMKDGKPSLKGYVYIAEGVTEIGDRAFQGCAGLVELEIPDSVTKIGERAFYQCTKLKKVTLGNGITTVPDYTFYKCEALETLYISDSVQSIGNYAFRGCAALANIKIGASVETIGKYAFYGCTAVQEIIIPTSVKNIGDYAFRACTRVKAVVLPETIDVIGKHAFYGLNSATFFCESQIIRPYWNERWNSSYRSVIWGCTLSEDKTYVVSVTMSAETINNPEAPDATLTPERTGYTFGGWALDATSQTPDYTAQTLASAPEGTTLYAIWTPFVPAEAETTN